MTSTKSTAFGVSAFLLLAGSIGFGQQQDRDLSGIHGIPVEGHDIVAGVEIVGTKQLDVSRSGWDERHQRLRANGADLKLGWPLESQTLCRFKEVLRDAGPAAPRLSAKYFTARGLPHALEIGTP